MRKSKANTNNNSEKDSHLLKSSDPYDMNNIEKYIHNNNSGKYFKDPETTTTTTTTTTTIEKSSLPTKNQYFLNFLERKFKKIILPKEEDDPTNIVDSIIQWIRKDFDSSEKSKKFFLLYESKSLIPENSNSTDFVGIEKFYLKSNLFRDEDDIQDIATHSLTSREEEDDKKYFEKHRTRISKFFIEGQKLKSIIIFNLQLSNKIRKTLPHLLLYNEEKLSSYLLKKSLKYRRIFDSLNTYSIQTDEKDRSLSSRGGRKNEKMNCIQYIENFFLLIEKVKFKRNDFIDLLDSREKEISNIQKKSKFSLWKSQMESLSIKIELSAKEILIYMGIKIFKQLLEKRIDDELFLDLKKIMDSFLFRKLLSIIIEHRLWSEKTIEEDHIDYAIIDNDNFRFELINPISIKPFNILQLEVRECEYWLRLIYLYNPDFSLEFYSLPYAFFCKNDYTRKILFVLCDKNESNRGRKIDEGEPHFYFPSNENLNEPWKEYSKDPSKKQFSKTLIHVLL